MGQPPDGRNERGAPAERDGGARAQFLRHQPRDGPADDVRPLAHQEVQRDGAATQLWARDELHARVALHEYGKRRAAHHEEAGGRPAERRRGCGREHRRAEHHDCQEDSGAGWSPAGREEQGDDEPTRRVKREHGRELPALP